MAVRCEKTGRWLPGLSGNPGGRPKEEADKIRDLARLWTADAFETIVDIMLDKNERGATRLKAADHVISRGWGKVVELKEDEEDVDGVTIQIELIEPDATQIN